MVIDRYKRPNRCKICDSRYREEIDKMLAGGTKYSDIQAWAEKRNTPLKFYKSTLSIHNNKHRIPSLNEFKKDNKIPTDKNQKKVRQKALSIIKDENLLSLTEFLNLVIASATHALVNNNSTPTIQEAVKAAEILNKVREGGQHEEALITLFKSFSMKK